MSTSTDQLHPCSEPGCRNLSDQGCCALQRKPSPPTPPLRGDQGGGERWAHFAETLGLPVAVAGVTQYGVHLRPGREHFVLDLDDGRHVHLGDTRTLLNRDAVTRKLLVAIGVAPRRLSRPGYRQLITDHIKHFTVVVDWEEERAAAADPRHIGLVPPANEPDLQAEAA